MQMSKALEIQLCEALEVIDSETAAIMALTLESKVLKQMCPRLHGWFVDELLALELDQRRMRIDHPPQGSKDSSDSLAGAVFQLTRIPPFMLVDKVKNAGYAAAVSNPALGGQVTGIPNLETGAMSIVRALRGMPSRL